MSVRNPANHRVCVAYYKSESRSTWAGCFSSNVVSCSEIDLTATHNIWTKATSRIYAKQPLSCLTCLQGVIERIRLASAIICVHTHAHTIVLTVVFGSDLKSALLHETGHRIKKLFRDCVDLAIHCFCSLILIQLPSFVCLNLKYGRAKSDRCRVEMWACTVSTCSGGTINSRCK